MEMELSSLTKKLKAIYPEMELSDSNNTFYINA